VTGIVWAAVLSAVAAALPSPLLTIGSPAPKFPLVTFVRGDPIKELTKGTVYVIEFSGVECVPCHKVIPLLTDLQKAHPKVVLVSVYSDDEKTVRAFLADKGKAAEYRVAVDPTGAVGKRWSQSALQDGIPHAFVVNAAGAVAWIGHAADLADPLARIATDTFDPGRDIMRLRVEQGVALRQRRLREGEEAGSAEYKRVNDLVLAGKLREALAATDRAVPRYTGFPQATRLLRGMKMYLLANLPGRMEEAEAFAANLAIEARLSGRWVEVANSAVGLLNAAERPMPAERNQRLVDLAVVLLTGPEPDDLRAKPAGEAQMARASLLGSLARAHHLRGDHRKAVVAIQDALVLTEKLKPDPGVDEKEFAAEQKQMTDYFRECLAEYRKAAGHPGK
jgi:thiol-disulfide isomerase/thioredoxin